MNGPTSSRPLAHAFVAVALCASCRSAARNAARVLLVEPVRLLFDRDDEDPCVRAHHHDTRSVPPFEVNQIAARRRSPVRAPSARQSKDLMRRDFAGFRVSEGFLEIGDWLSRSQGRQLRERKSARTRDQTGGTFLVAGVNVPQRTCHKLN